MNADYIHEQAGWPKLAWDGKMKMPSFLKFLSILCCVAAATEGRAAMLVPNGSTPPNYFGVSVSLSNDRALVGAYYDSITGTSYAGAAYLYDSVSNAAGSTFQNTRLNPATPTATEFFGVSTGISGSIGLVGTSYTNSNRGAVYLFRGLGSTSGVQTQTTTFSLAGAELNANFGRSVSVSGTTGLIGASGIGTGGNSAYLYRGLDTATGNPNPNAKLVASGAASSAAIGTSVSLSGTNGLVGASSGNLVYLYRNLDTAIGEVTQTAVLTGATGSNNGFGRAVSLDGGNALVGAPLEDGVYLYRNLDTTSSTSIAHVAKLVASDDSGTFGFGTSVAISGKNGIVGAPQKSSNAGGAYLYTDLDTITGNNRLETVRISAVTPVNNSVFGQSVAIDGDTFIIGARGNTTTIGGTAYTGSVSSLTTLDVGSASRTVDQIAFTSRTNWVVGKTTGGNSVTLTNGSVSTITAGNHVYVGQEAGSDNNTLTIEGSLTAGSVYIGSESGNTGNSFIIGSSGIIQVSSIYLAPNNVFSIEGDYSNPTAFFDYLGTKGITLNTFETQWNALNIGNYNDSVAIGFSNGYTNVTAIPEPSTIALIGLSVCGGVVAARRRRRE